MAIETLDVTAIPSAVRTKSSAILDTPEFKQAINTIPTLKPGKAIRISLSKETLRLGKHVGYQMKRQLTVWVKSQNLKREIFLRGKSPEGAPFVYVANPAVEEKPAKDFKAAAANDRTETTKKK